LAFRAFLPIAVLLTPDVSEVNALPPRAVQFVPVRLEFPALFPTIVFPLESVTLRVNVLTAPEKRTLDPAPVDALLVMTFQLLAVGERAPPVSPVIVRATVPVSVTNPLVSTANSAELKWQTPLSPTVEEATA